MHWLRPSKVNESMQRFLSTRANGTCEWILKDAVFKNWLNCAFLPLQERVLMIDGAPGCGKSVLGSFIYNTLENQGNHHMTIQAAVLYFSFSENDMERHTLDACVRTLFSQLLEQANSQELLPLLTSLTEKGNPTTMELFNAFQRAIETYSKPVRAIIDGVDECSDPKDVTGEYLLEKLPLSPNLKILVLGQPRTMVKFRTRVRGKQYPKISITSQTNLNDIRAVIDRGISQSTILSKSLVRDKILATLLDEADGMFLWVNLMLEYLSASLCDDEVLTRLADLPRGLEQSYISVLARLSARLDKHQKRLVGHLFAFATCCGRALKFEEVQYAYALATKPDSESATLESFMLRIQPDDIVDLCGGLVLFTNGALRLMHNSVRTFLIRPQEEWIDVQHSALNDFRVDPTSSHRLLSKTCLRYFQEVDLTQLQWEHLSSLDLVDVQQPFLNYACAYTAYHINRSDFDTEEVFETTSAFIESDNSMHTLEYFFVHGINDSSLQTQVELWALLDVVRSNTKTPEIVSSLELRLKKRNDIDSDFRGLNSHTIGRNVFREAFVSFVDQARSERQPQLRSRPHGVEPRDCNNTDSTSQNLAMTGRVHHELNFNPSNEPLLRNRLPRFLGRSEIASVTNRVDGLMQVPIDLGLGGQLHSIVRILQHAALPRMIVDPFHALWNLIKRKAATMPLIHLAAVTLFHHAYERNDEAFEIGNICLQRMGDSETTLYLIVRCLMGAIAYKVGKDELAIKHSEYAIPKMDALLGPTRFTLYNAKMFLADSYESVGRHSDAVALLKGLVKDRSVIRMVDKKRQARTYLHLSQSVYSAGNDREAIVFLRKYLKISGEIKAGSMWNEDRDVRNAHCFLAQLCYNLSDYDETLMSIKRWEKMVEEAGIPPKSSEAKELKRLRAMIHCRRLDTSKRSQSLAEEALWDYIQHNCDTYGTDACVKARQDWFIMLSDCEAFVPEDTIKIYNKFWDTYTAFHKAQGFDFGTRICSSFGYACYDLARLHQKINQHAEARNMLLQSLTAFRDTEAYQRHRLLLHIHLSVSETNLGNYSAAQTAADEVLLLLEKYTWSSHDRILFLRDLMELKLQKCYQLRGIAQPQLSLPSVLHALP